MKDPAIWFGIAFAAFVVVGAVTVTVINAARIRRRADDLRCWAMQHGYDFRIERTSAADYAPIAYFTDTSRVSSATACNVMRRDQLIAFDLIRSVKTSGESPEPTTESCVLFALDEALPTFSFTAFSTAPQVKGILATAKRFARVDMLEIDGRPGFFLRTANPRGVQPLFAGGRARFFDDKVGWGVEAEGRWLLVRAGWIGPPVRWFPLPGVASSDYGRFISIAQSVHDYFVHAHA